VRYENSITAKNMTLKKEVNHQGDLSKLAKNAGISGIGEIIFNILAYTTNIVMTRTVGPSIYGVFSLANNITNITQIISTSGPGHGLLRFVAFYKGKKDFSRLKGAIIFGTKITFILSVFFAICIFYLSDIIAVRIFHNAEVGKAIKILMISLPFLTLGTIWLESIQSFQVIKYCVVTKKIFQPISRLVIMITLFLVGFKLVGILIASIISAVVGFFFALYYLLKISAIHKRFPKPIYEKREITSFSLPISFIQFLSIATLYTDSLMLGYFKTSFEVGVYAAVTKVALLIELPLVSFNGIFGPMVSEFYGKHEMQNVENLFKVVTKWIFALSLSVFFIFILFAQPIMGIFGQVFRVGATALIILGVGLLINASTGASGMIITMTGRPKINLMNSIVFFFLNIALNYFFIPRYGLIGAALATGISIGVLNILKLAEVFFILKIHPYEIKYLKPFIAGLLSFLIIYSMIYNLPSVSLFTVTVFSFVYFGLYAFLIYLFRLEEEDKYILNLIYNKLIKLKGSI
jgi:O-antigen/teichoic acid export membrane protein